MALRNEERSSTLTRSIRSGIICLHMITLGNLSGNTFDPLLSRLRGCPAEGSSLGSELAALSLLALGTPILVLGIAAKCKICRCERDNEKADVLAEQKTQGVETWSAILRARGPKT